MDRFGTSLADDPRTEADDALNQLHAAIGELKQAQLNQDADRFQDTYDKLSRRLGELAGVPEDNVTNAERVDIEREAETASLQIRALLYQL